MDKYTKLPGINHGEKESPVKDRPYAGTTAEAAKDNTRHYKMMHVDGKAANPHSEGVKKN